MDCSHDFALHDEEFLSLVLNDRVLSIEKQAHLEQCVLCQQRLAQIHQVNNVLVKRLYRVFCPSSIQLSLYCADMLPSAVALHIVKHVLSCPLCAREVADTRSFIQDRSLESSPVPFAAVRRVIGIMVEPQVQLATRGEVSSPKIWSHQYHAEDIDLSLHLIPSSHNDYVLLGVLASADSEEGEDLFDGARVVLDAGSSLTHVQIPLPEARPVLRTLVDDLGNFAFSSIPGGEYTLLVHLPDRDVVIKQIIVEQT